MDTNEFSVDEGSFWHTNMSLYFGYQPGEVVEVEHEPNKYWLATIKYSYRHLISLDWLGHYGNFWMELSNITSSSSALTISDGYYIPKRIFPLGHHLQSQLKSQFILEKPSKVLDKPTLYNPRHDPYGDIETIDDLLALDLDEIHPKDAFREQVQSNIGESASLVMAKCKTQIAFGQEDVDELEAALLNLTEIVSDQQPEIAVTNTMDISKMKQDETNTNNDIQSDSTSSAPIIIKRDDKLAAVEPQNASKSEPQVNKSYIDSAKVESYMKLCKSLQESAISTGKYAGIGEYEGKVFYLKPKQFYDIGGANHERLVVPGTLFEVCHWSDDDSGLAVYHWFAIVLKNIGGRLTLRWLLCDEPKFKQGRLELKSYRSQFISEDEDPDESTDVGTEENSDHAESTKLSAKDITFCMHFCDPCIFTISHAKSIGRSYRMPKKILSFIEGSGRDVQLIRKAQLEHVFDPRRINLDKDRPLIDHLLTAICNHRPSYAHISAPQNVDERCEVLLSTSKTTRLFRGFIKRKIECGVYEIQSEPISESGDAIRFVYPYDSSYSLLPVSWAINNEDCLSIACSRNPSPAISAKVTDGVQSEARGTECIDQRSETAFNSSNENETAIEEESVKCPVKIVISHNDSRVLTDDNDGITLDLPKKLGNGTTNLNKYSISLNLTHKDQIDSRFRIMDQLEVVHPSSHSSICCGRIRKVVYPLLWIQLSTDSYTLLPFNSTDIYPAGWGASNNQSIISLLPSLKRPQQSSQQEKKKKKVKTNGDEASGSNEVDSDIQRSLYEREKFDLGSINDKPLDIDYLLNDNIMYDRVYFNHKCFTGPSLSKGKICSLPQYVGPGPLRLVMEEVVTKVISVAYVPPRILNDLSSKAFEELLIARNLKHTVPIEFKAKYQKRIHREDIQVCLNPDDVALYCECICEHLKCCYNLFGPSLYDGDDCPGHCRALTKSNKFMKRATYYREKARLGEFTNDNNSNKKSNSNSSNSTKTSRARYAGRGSSESVSSTSSTSERIQSVSRASSNGVDTLMGASKENLAVVEEMDVEHSKDSIQQEEDNQVIKKEEATSPTTSPDPFEPETKGILNSTEPYPNQILTKLIQNSATKWHVNSDFETLDSSESKPEEWSVEEVAIHLERCRLEKFKSLMMSEVSLTSIYPSLQLMI